MGVGYDDTSWRVGFKCESCDTDIIAFVTDLGEKHIEYGFACTGCKITGDWKDLVRGYFESTGDRGRQTSKKNVAPREF